MEVSVGICAHNEEQNIGHLLDTLLNQKTEVASIGEIIVVSSGSTDRTNEIVTRYSRKDKRVRLIPQQEREGKPSAINTWLKNVKAEVCVMISADLLPLENTLENLVRPLLDPKVGFAGSHPMPINDASTFVGFVVNLYWKLHHLMALKHSKGGEMIAFRNVVPQILNTASDEANIEALILRRGYKLAYAPDAIVRNKGPETIKEYLKQRRRQNVGRIHLQKALGYKTATMNNFLVLKTLLSNMKFTPRDILWTAASLLVEFYGRLLAMYDWYIKKDDHVKWAIVTTTKRLDK